MVGCSGRMRASPCLNGGGIPLGSDGTPAEGMIDMTTRMVTVGLIAGVMLGAAPAVRADTLEEVENRIAEAIQKHKSLIITMRVMFDRKLGALEVKSKSETVSEYRILGDGHWLARIETKQRGTLRFQDAPERKTESSTLTIRDGTHNYTYYESEERKHVMKSRIDPERLTDPLGVRAQFKALRDSVVQKLIRDETVDGKRCYVIETTLRKEEAAHEDLDFVRSVTWYDKESGVMLKAAGYDESGREVMSFVTTEVRIDADIPDDRFVFKAPAGVDVVDLDALEEEAHDGRPDDRPAARE